MRRDSLSLEALLDNPRIWSGRQQGKVEAGLSSGYEKLDRHLPGGGWPRHALTEILTGHYGIGELQLLMPALSRLSADDPEAPYTEPGWIAWVAPPFHPYPPALQEWGMNLSRLLVVRPREDTEILWSAEQALSSGTCSAVLLWPEWFDDRAGRRLQLAAEKGGSWAIVFRPLAACKEPSAATLRIAVQAGSAGTDLHIFKNRGSRPVILHNVFGP